MVHVEEAEIRRQLAQMREQQIDLTLVRVPCCICKLRQVYLIVPTEVFNEAQQHGGRMPVLGICSEGCAEAAKYKLQGGHT